MKALTLLERQQSLMALSKYELAMSLAYWQLKYEGVEEE